MRSTGSRRPLLLAIIAILAVVLVGLASLREDNQTAPAPRVSQPPVEVEPARLRDVASTLALSRAPFCEAVGADAAEAALGGPVSEQTTYDNGDPVEVGRLSDVSHEYGCQWTAGNAITARVWVFVPPVTPREARSMIAVAEQAPGCSRIAGSYGAPSVGLACTGKSRQQASYRGLFGDAWLTCTLSAPTSVTTERIARRADRWCAAVALAAEG